MNPRLQDVPVYESIPVTVSADHYGLARIALKRLPRPVRMQIPKLRSLDLLIEDDAWMVIDRSLNDVPVLAWLNFDVHDRALHQPVPCRLNLYHAHGKIIVDKVLEAMALLLGEQLAERFPQDKAGVHKLTLAR